MRFKKKFLLYLLPVIAGFAFQEWSYYISKTNNKITHFENLAEISQATPDSNNKPEDEKSEVELITSQPPQAPLMCQSRKVGARLRLEESICHYKIFR